MMGTIYMKTLILEMQTTTHPSEKTRNTKIIMMRNLQRMLKLQIMGMMMIIITNTPKIKEIKKTLKLQE